MPQFPDTADLKAIEKMGASWASSCMINLFAEMDLRFFSTQYRPFFESLKWVDGRFQITLTDFDPFSQHKHCRALLGPAFGTRGALMMSSSTSPLGRVPDFRFAAFEAGAIRAIRLTWETKKRGRRKRKNKRAGKNQ